MQLIIYFNDNDTFFILLTAKNPINNNAYNTIHALKGENRKKRRKGTKLELTINLKS